MYSVERKSFTVSPWTGVRVGDLRAEPGGGVSFVVDPVTYPRTYASPFRFIGDDKDKNLCKTCSFRPWASTASVATAYVTVDRDHGPDRLVAAVYRDGRWYADTDLRPGERAYVAAGGVRDANGETNGVATNVVTGTPRSI